MSPSCSTKRRRRGSRIGRITTELSNRQRFTHPISSASQMTEQTEQLVLGVEGGGSKTDWILVRTERGGSLVIDHGQLPAANFILISEEHLLDMLQQLPIGVDRVGVFLAGCKTEEDRSRLRTICENVW